MVCHCYDGHRSQGLLKPQVRTSSLPKVWKLVDTVEPSMRMRLNAKWLA